jgi:uncharacterized delta-60 repeat protein
MMRILMALPSVWTRPGRNRHQALALSLGVALVLAVTAPSAIAAPGDPDTSFNGTGARTYQPRGLSEGFVNDVAIQPDGKILVAGAAGPYRTSPDHDFIVLRLNPDGSPDPSFGLGGTASVDFANQEGTTANDYANALALQSTGKIVVVGQSYTNSGSGSTSSNQHAAIARLNVDGSLDTTFVNSGKLIENFTGTGGGGACCTSGDTANDVAVLPDDRLVVVGQSSLTSGSPPTGNFFALGLIADGRRDNSFGSAGRAYADFGAQDVAKSVTRTAGGDFVLAGYTNDGSSMRPVAARLSSTGDPVGGFGTAGKRFFAGEGTLDDVAAQADGKLVLAATRHNDDSSEAGVSRIYGDGSIDRLGGEDLKTIPSAVRDEDAGSVAVDSAGRLLLAARVRDTEFRIAFRLVRFTPGGEVDTTFGGGDGFVELPLGVSLSGYGYGYPRVAAQSDGRIVLAGAEGSFFGVRRFLGDSPAAPGGPPPGGSTGPVADRVAPIVSSIKRSAARWRLGSKLASFAKAKKVPVGMTVSWKLTEAATMTFSFDAIAAGRRVGRKCAAPKKSNRKRAKCTRYVPKGSLKRSAPAGAGKLLFQGRISKSKRLRPGKYRLRIDAADAAGNRSPTKTLTFTSVR